MSLSYQALRPVLVKDPRVIIENKRDYAVIKAGKQVMYKAYTSTSISQSSIQFSCPPPSGGVIVDRKQYFTLPVRLTFTGPGTNSSNLLIPNQDAPRSYPLSSSIDTMQVTINNTSVSINMADVIQALLHFNTDAKLKEYDYSMTPTCPDQAQNYSDLQLAIRNPLAFYGDSNDEGVMGRGGFEFTVVSNSPTAAVVDMVITEPVFLSPFYWGLHNASGFTNVNTMDFNVSFLNNTGFRMWSHDNLTLAGANTISTIVAQFNGFEPAFTYKNQIQPQLLFTYISPLDTELVPVNVPITYPYFDITRFPTDNVAITYAKGNVCITSNNIQLSSIPRRMYIFARASNSALYSSPNLTDTFYGIDSINVQFNNQTGLLSSASQQQLYEMSLKNHCNMSWTQWSGGPTYPVGSFTNANQIGTMGSILCVEFGTDIALGDLEAPGINGQYQLQVQANIYNPDPSTNHDAIPITLYIVIVSEGTFTIEALGKSMTQLGVISRQDVLDARRSPFVNYKDVQQVNGGNFLSGLKEFGSKLFHGLQDSKAISKGLRSLSSVPSPFGQIASVAAPIAEAFGFGEGGAMHHRKHRGRGVEVGGVSVAGGESMNRSLLKKRLRF